MGEHKQPFGFLKVDVFQATLLNNTSGVHDGLWQEFSGCRSITIEIAGIVVATVQVRGSNMPTTPAPSYQGFQVGNDVVANGAVAIGIPPLPIRWIKCRIVSYTSGVISAWGEGIS